MGHIEIGSDTQKLMRSGESRTQSFGQAISNSLSIEKAHAEVQKTNSGAWLRGWAEYNNPDQKVLHVEKYNEGFIGVMEPTGKYTPLDWLVWAADNEQWSTPDSELVPVRRAEDYPDEFFSKYVGANLRLLITLQKLYPQNKAIITENNMPDLTNGHGRITRSIALPHSHILSVADDHITPGWESDERKADEPRRRFERSQLRRIMNRLLPQVINEEIDPQYAKEQKEIQDILTQLSEKGAVIKARKVAPHGYSLEAEGITQENALDRIDGIVEILRLNDAFYKTAEQLMRNKFSNELETVSRWYSRRHNDFSLKPPLTRRQYIHFAENGNLTIITSPEIFDHSGPMEAAKVASLRSPVYPDMVTPEERENVNNHIRMAFETEPV